MEEKDKAASAAVAYAAYVEATKALAGVEMEMKSKLEAAQAVYRNALNAMNNAIIAESKDA